MNDRIARGASRYVTNRAQLMEARLSALADNILLLDVELNGKARRTIRVVKARGVEHAMDKHELQITKAGVQVV